MHHMTNTLTYTNVAAYLGSDGRAEICTTLTFVTLQHSIIYCLVNISLIWLLPFVFCSKTTC